MAEINKISDEAASFLYALFGGHNNLIMGGGIIVVLIMIIGIVVLCNKIQDLIDAVREKHQERCPDRAQTHFRRTDTNTTITVDPRLRHYIREEC